MSAKSDTFPVYLVSLRTSVYILKEPCAWFQPTEIVFIKLIWMYKRLVCITHFETQA